MWPRRFSTNFALLALLIDGLLVWLSYRLATAGAGANLGGVVVIIWVAALLIGAAYDPDKSHKATDEFQIVVLAHGFGLLLFAGCLYLFQVELARAYFVRFAVLALVALLGWRGLLRIVYRYSDRLWRRTRVVIVGANETGREFAEAVDRVSDDRLAIVGYVDDKPPTVDDGVPLLGGFGDLVAIVKRERIEDVIITLSGAQYDVVNDIIYQLHRLPVQVHVIPDYFNLALFRARVDNFGGFPMINLRAPALTTFQRMIKRLFDVAISLLLLLLLSPLLLLAALAIRLDSADPIFFRQRRIGENGRLFTMIKFRTMVIGADSLPQSKQRHDPRVTPIGRWLRRTSLDEAPQLLNVLRGEMSLVGPRPELPWLVDRYETWQRTRFAVPQGMTGWWQVNGRADRPMHLHTEDDIYYIQNYSLWLDLYILLKTPLVVLRGKGAF